MLQEEALVGYKMIKLIKSSFLREREVKEKLANFIRSADFLSMGDECARFEKSFARKQEREHAVLVNSGSSANLILLQALLNLGRLKIGDRIGVSVLTWATNVMPVIQLGLIPVAIDCELETLNVSSRTLTPYLSSINGLFITNVLGFSSDISEIQRLCAERNIVLLEDNCESLGSRVDGSLFGNFGVASTFSFFAGHHISAIEGGMVCTDDDELLRMLLLVRAHGWDRNLTPTDRDALRSHHGIDDFYAKYAFYDLGYNVRPTEITGFLGNVQLEYWDEIVAKRQENFMRFYAATQPNTDILPLNVRHMGIVSNFAMPIVLKTRELFEAYRAKFENAGVEIRPIIAGDITLQPFYRKYVSDTNECPNARLIHSQGFYFPNNPELTTDEVEVLCSLLAV
jgi:CDP-6-deoxy-D-xylo-4-hexulose-3-dehydrase